MALGALAGSGADVSVSVTGVAGPGGGSAEKPVGLVHFGAVGPHGEIHAMHRFGDIGRERLLDETRHTCFEQRLDNRAMRHGRRRDRHRDRVHPARRTIRRGDQHGDRRRPRCGDRTVRR